jgi:GMP synthase-like glutamine amidotransferase
MHEIEVTDSDDRLFKDVRKANLPTIQWHQDEVRDLPKGALSIASSKHCRNQIYRIGSLHYAVQFHPEADLSIVRMWEKEADEAYRRSGRSSDAAGVIEAEVALRMAEMKELWSQVIKGWAVIASQELETRLSRQ